MKILGYRKKDGPAYFTEDNVLPAKGKDSLMTVVAFVWELALVKRINPAEIMDTLLTAY